MKYWWAWLLLILSLSGEWWLLRLWLEKKQFSQFDRIILQSAEAYSLEPALIKAVIWKESEFDTFATGSAGEIGLMQLTDAAAFEWADDSKITTFEPDHLYHPSTNTLAGCYYLAKMVKRFPKCDDPIPFALASYNAGYSQVRRWSQGNGTTNAATFIEQIGFPSTKHYVKSILNRRQRFKSEFKQ